MHVVRVVAVEDQFHCSRTNTVHLRVEVGSRCRQGGEERVEEGAVGDALSEQFEHDHKRKARSFTRELVARYHLNDDRVNDPEASEDPP